MARALAAFLTEVKSLSGELLDLLSILVVLALQDLPGGGRGVVEEGGEWWKPHYF